MNFMYNGMVFLGTFVGGIILLSRYTQIVLNLSRVLFLATFLLVFYQVPPKWLFESDWFKLLNVALLAFSNGMFNTNCSIMSPMQVSDDRKSAVGSLIGLTIVTGILSGSIIAVPLNKALLG